MNLSRVLISVFLVAAIKISKEAITGMEIEYVEIVGTRLEHLQ